MTIQNNLRLFFHQVTPSFFSFNILFKKGEFHAFSERFSWVLQMSSTDILRKQDSLPLERGCKV
jgi:hypothetical protein